MGGEYVCVSVDSERVQSEGSPGADWSAHDMACESHAPSAAVQWSQQELLRNVTAIKDGTAQTPAATALQACRASQHNNLLLEYKQAFFLPPPLHLEIHCISVTTMEDDSSEKAPYILMWE